MSDNIQEILNTKLLSKVLSISHYQRGNVLTMSDLKMKLGSTPDSEIEQDAVIELVEKLGLLSRRGELDEQLRRHEDVDVNQLGVDLLQQLPDNRHAAAPDNDNVSDK